MYSIPQTPKCTLQVITQPYQAVIIFNVIVTTLFSQLHICKNTHTGKLKTRKTIRLIEAIVLKEVLNSDVTTHEALQLLVFQFYTLGIQFLSISHVSQSKELV